MFRHHFSNKELVGGLAIVLSAIFFYLPSALIRLSASSGPIPSIYFVFSRSVVGLLVIVCILLWRRRWPNLSNISILVGRGLGNWGALIFFYKAVTLTSSSEANILNMTYPLFVALWSFFASKTRDVPAYWMTLLAFMGIVLVIRPDQPHFNAGTLYGLLSGLSAGAAIVFLESARQDNDTVVVLLFTFGVGTLGSLLLGWSELGPLTAQQQFYVWSSGTLGVLGMYLLTFGAMWVTAVEGSILSSSRMIFAAVLGPVICGDPKLTLVGWVGAFCIFFSNAFLAWRKSRLKQVVAAAEL